MSVVREEDAVTHTVHGSTFRSYVSGGTGAELCAWLLTVPAELPGVPHRPDRDEVLFVLDGTLTVTLNGQRCEAGAGSVVHVRAGDLFRAGGGPAGATCWVTTTPGLVATLADGSTMRPPWAQ